MLAMLFGYAKNAWSPILTLNQKIAIQFFPFFWREKEKKTCCKNLLFFFITIFAQFCQSASFLKAKPLDWVCQNKFTLLNLGWSAGNFEIEKFEKRWRLLNTYKQHYIYTWYVLDKVHHAYNMIHINWLYCIKHIFCFKIFSF